MKDTVTPTLNKQFVLDSLAQKIRLDGRRLAEIRDLHVEFYETCGSVEVCLGATRIFAKVSPEIMEPKLNRLSEGSLLVNLELSPMASPAYFDIIRSETIILSRLLERILKESRCIDFESLCIVKGEKCWNVRLDVHVLNYDGNIIQCACIASLLALAHVRIPLVTVDNKKLTINSLEEELPLRLTLLHWPLITTFIYTPTAGPVMDPCESEEIVASSTLVVGVNKHREICCMHKLGSVTVTRDQVIMAVKLAVIKSGEMYDFLQDCLRQDEELRYNSNSFAKCVWKSKAEPTPVFTTQEIEGNHQTTLHPDFDSDDDNDQEMSDINEESIGMGGETSWNLPAKLELASTSPQKSNCDSIKKKKTSGNSDSEEEAVETFLL